ncbi:hypothetical protein M0R45_037189 [Rubus argutus]|uniref:Uncharacterized protein n=1 Tax=Rubus argutus TaxID=59490 RepID=A0AAW1W239_RUBAR
MADEVSAELIVREATIEEVRRCLSRWDWVKRSAVKPCDVQGCSFDGCPNKLIWAMRAVVLSLDGGGKSSAA